jgi:hypothetical protein
MTFRAFVHETPCEAAMCMEPSGVWAVPHLMFAGAARGWAGATSAIAAIEAPIARVRQIKRPISAPNRRSQTLLAREVGQRTRFTRPRVTGVVGCGPVRAMLGAMLSVLVVVGAGLSPTASAKPVGDLFYTPGGIVACAMGDGAPDPAADQVTCSYGAPRGAAYAQLTADGKVAICTPAHHPMTPPGGNCLYFGSVLKNAVHYPAGKTVNVGRFQCKVLAVGVQCTVRSTGKGFRITRHTAVRIGPSAQQRA